MRVVVLHLSTKFEVRRKIRRTMCVSINGPGDLDLETSRIEGGEPSFQIWAPKAFGFSSYSLCTRRTDGRTDKSNA